MLVCKSQSMKNSFCAALCLHLVYVFTDVSKRCFRTLAYILFRKTNKNSEWNENHWKASRCFYLHFILKLFQMPREKLSVKTKFTSALQLRKKQSEVDTFMGFMRRSDKLGATSVDLSHPFLIFRNFIYVRDHTTNCKRFKIFDIVLKLPAIS